MVKVQLLAPATDKDGNPLAAGAIVDLDDETAHDLRMDGKAAAVPEEGVQRQPGVYNARTDRPAVAETKDKTEKK